MFTTDKAEQFMGTKDQQWIQEQFAQGLPYKEYLEAVASNKNNFHRYQKDNGFHVVKQEEFDEETKELNQSIIDTCEICYSQRCRTHDLRFSY
jgi:hypothetical protein|tara:strand:+ start:81 stop:359 length:279 start_codon:yes stop_codon:yes gene_type:complete